MKTTEKLEIASMISNRCGLVRWAKERDAAEEWVARTAVSSTETTWTLLNGSRQLWPPLRAVALHGFTSYCHPQL